LIDDFACSARGTLFHGTSLSSRGPVFWCDARSHIGEEKRHAVAVLAANDIRERDVRTKRAGKPASEV
jgi:hypothetical protein